MITYKASIGLPASKDTNQEEIPEAFSLEKKANGKYELLCCHEDFTKDQIIGICQLVIGHLQNEKD
jgi:hypothetical protein